VTALRVAALLRGLGHRVRVRQDDDGRAADALIALHARKSAAAIAAIAARQPAAPVVLVLTGTDVYPELDDHLDAAAAVRRADRLVVLQPLARAALPGALRAKARVIVQSATAPPPAPRRAGTFDVCVLAHVRAVKDPLLVGEAVARTAPGLPLRVRHAGAVLEPELEAPLRALASARYRWLGPLDRRAARELLASSDLLVIPSRNEGGANVASEAIAAGLAVLATDVPGNRGILGADHPGLFPPGDAGALAALLARACTDAGYLAALRAHTARLQPAVRPERERAAWAALLAELFAGGTALAGAPA
jgi:putative glycosyltransferase (TIGR04348 family)